MQATPTVNSSHSSEIRIAAITIAVLGFLTLGTVFTITNDGSSSRRAYVPSYVEPKTIDAFRFAEMNALPEPRTLTMNRQRFVDINQLPEAASIGPMTYEQSRFQEINVLPGSTRAPNISFERLRFLEINAVHGGVASLVAPSTDQRGERH